MVSITSRSTNKRDISEGVCGILQKANVELGEVKVSLETITLGGSILNTGRAILLGYAFAKKELNWSQYRTEVMPVQRATTSVSIKVKSAKWTGVPESSSKK